MAKENSTRDKARVVTENLASRWNGGREILDRLSAASAGTTNPFEALQALDNRRLGRLFSGSEAREKLDAAFQSLMRYLTEETWFDRASRDDARLSVLREHPIAYLCMEFGLEDWLPIYSGGLGILAGDVLKESSDLGLPFVGVGLLYRHGFFTQKMDESDYQTEVFPTLDPTQLPLTPVTKPSGERVIIAVPLEDRQVYAQIWRLQVGRTALYLLDCDIAQNEREDDRSLTSSLYGGDQDTRVRQEVLLGIGGVRALRALGIEPSVYSMNEGHAAFLGVELLADEVRTSDFSTALQRVHNRIVYTNHTVVPAGNDIFPWDLVRRYLGRYVEERGIGVQRLLELASGGQEHQFSMAILAFQLSGKANAVSQLHGQVIPREWPGFAVEAVTNGVHAPTWLGPEMTALLQEYVPDWRSDSPSWENIRSIPDDVVWRVREAQRHSMIATVNQTRAVNPLDPEALTIVWARRFAEYKRPGLLASDLARLSRLVSTASRPVQVIISGKSHPRDEGGKRTMQALLHHLEQDNSVHAHVAFVEDYRVSVGRCLTGGADVWLNTPRRPLEASGTSGMKSSDNGGLQLTVRDGWAWEVDWWQVGWGIEGRDDVSDAGDLYQYLEHSVVPTFYDRNDAGVPEGWVAMMKNTMILTLSRYSTRRMVLEYLHKLYLPLLEQQAAYAPVA